MLKITHSAERGRASICFSNPRKSAAILFEPDDFAFTSLGFAAMARLMPSADRRQALDLVGVTSHEPVSSPSADRAEKRPADGDRSEPSWTFGH